MKLAFFSLQLFSSCLGLEELWLVLSGMRSHQHCDCSFIQPIMSIYSLLCSWAFRIYHQQTKQTEILILLQAMCIVC